MGLKTALFFKGMFFQPKEDSRLNKHHTVITTLLFLEGLKVLSIAPFLDTSLKMTYPK